MEFTNLIDNTPYTAYFIGENDLPVNPDLMDRSEMKTVNFRTKKEIYSVPWDYNSV